MRFRDVCHQERALSILRRALASGRTHHAYLFSGPEGVGKALTARALAARLLCQDDSLPAEEDACGACQACRLFETGNHPDFHWIHRGLHKQHPDRTIRASKGLFLVVDVIRHFLIEPAANTPNLGRRRVFVIEGAERMNEGAQNALLKTLEEPPGQAVLVLVTASAERLLPTIRSRCQAVPFDLLPTDFVCERLMALADADADAAHTLAELAQGRLGVALRWHRMDLLETLVQLADALAAGLVQDPERFGKTVIELASDLAVRDAEVGEDSGGPNADAEPVEINKSRGGAKTIETDQLRDALKLVLMLVAAICRDALLAAFGDVGKRALPPDNPAVRWFAAANGSDELASYIDAVAAAERMLDRNVNPQLACERLAITLSGGAPVH